MKNDLSTDHNGGIDNMSGNYDVVYRYSIGGMLGRLFRIIVTYKTFPFLALSHIVW